jgi:hypothetical protein
MVNVDSNKLADAIGDQRRACKVPHNFIGMTSFVSSNKKKYSSVRHHGTTASSHTSVGLVERYSAHTCRAAIKADLVSDRSCAK